MFCAHHNNSVNNQMTWKIIGENGLHEANGKDGKDSQPLLLGNDKQNETFELLQEEGNYFSSLGNWCFFSC